MGAMKALLITVYGGGDEAVAAAETLAGLGRWIPVEERWPEHLSDVLVAYKCGKYVRLGVGEFDGTTVNDEGIAIPHFKGIGGFEVTHWMPLPEPPEVADAMLRERLRNGATSGCETVQSGCTESRRGPLHVTETYFKNDENATDSSTNREPVARHPQTALTDEEREAVRFFSQIDGPGNVPLANKRAATLRGFLERLK